jgi:formamidopyrimidine-DNA glycosylase
VPELPDVVVYVESLKARVAGRRLENVRLLSPFVLRSVDPPVEAIRGTTITDVRRIGKRIVLAFGSDLFLVIHLMIAGRLRWRWAPAAMPHPNSGPLSASGDEGRGDAKKPPAISSKIILAVFEFEHGSLFFTEASSKKRASLQIVGSEDALSALDPGGVEPLEVSLDVFRDALKRENHTLKRTLTDPHIFSGIGNAYSDEILHAAKLSPLKLSQSLTDEECARLREATRRTLANWIERLRADAVTGFPEKVTAFREGMAVHGRFKQPCPVCGSPVQRIVYAENECNYCATCQTGGRLLADRSLSRLLKDDWPKWLES